MIRHRSLFVSDVHIGTRSCRARQLLTFLKSNRANITYLVGDIVDAWNEGVWYTDSDQEALLTYINNNADRIFYIYGNHEKPNLDFVRSKLQLEQHEFTIHTCKDFRRFLVIHGDQYDVIKGEFHILRQLYKKVNKIHDGKLYAKLSDIIDRITSVDFKRFRMRAVKAARKARVQGIICGHIHAPRLESIDGILYLNSGDWVYHQSAITEDFNGQFRLVKYSVSEPI